MFGVEPYLEEMFLEKFHLMIFDAAPLKKLIVYERTAVLGYALRTTNSCIQHWFLVIIFQINRQIRSFFCLAI